MGHAPLGPGTAWVRQVTHRSSLATVCNGVGHAPSGNGVGHAPSGFRGETPGCVGHAPLEPSGGTCSARGPDSLIAVLSGRAAAGDRGGDDQVEATHRKPQRWSEPDPRKCPRRPNRACPPPAGACPPTTGACPPTTRARQVRVHQRQVRVHQRQVRVHQPVRRPPRDADPGLRFEIRPRRRRSPFGPPPPLRTRLGPRPPGVSPGSIAPASRARSRPHLLPVRYTTPRTFHSRSHHP